MISIGKAWKTRLQTRRIPAGSRAHQRAEGIIQELQRMLKRETGRQYMVMDLYTEEALVSFAELRGKQHQSSELFLGAAKAVVDYCLESDLDVYVWGASLSRPDLSSVGAAIWVTARGVSPHLPG